MSIRHPGPAALTLRVETATTASAAASWNCRRCGEELELHQPDATDPGRLLGTCAGCGGWYLIGELSEGRLAVWLHLPDQAELRTHFERDEPAPGAASLTESWPCRGV